MNKHSLITGCIVAAAAALAALGIWLIQTSQPGHDRPSIRLEQPSATPSPSPSGRRPESPETQGTTATDPDPSTAADGGLSPAHVSELDAAATAFVASYHRRSFEDAGASSWLAGAVTNCTPEMARDLKARFSGDGGLQWTRFVEGRSLTEARVLRTKPERTDQYAAGKATMIVDYTVTTQSQDPMIAATDIPYVRSVELIKVGDQWKVASMSNLSGEPTA